MRRLLSRSAMTNQDPAPTGAPLTVRSEHGYAVPRRLELRPRDHSADDAATQRARRRRCLTVELDDRFTLSAEIRASLDEVRAALSDEQHPATWARQVDELVAGINEVIAGIGRLIEQKTRWVPEPAPSSLVDGSWVDSIVEVAEPLDRPLQTALGRQSLSRNASQLSDDVVAALRTMDRVAAQMHQSLRQAHTARMSSARKPRSPLSISFDQARARNERELNELHSRHRAELQQLWAVRRGL